MTVMSLHPRTSEVGAASGREAGPAILRLEGGAGAGEWPPGLAEVLQGSANRLVLAQELTGDGPAAADEQLGAFGAGALGSVMPTFANVVDGTHGTGANAALGILGEMAAGRPPFRPELGRNGPVQWFVTDGNPYTGRTSPDVVIPAEVVAPRGRPVLEFRDADLVRIHSEIMDEIRPGIARQVAGRYPDSDPSSNRSRIRIEQQAFGAAERRMWTEVGERVAASPGGVGHVIQSADSPFSRGRPGTFTLTSQPDLMRVRGGPQALLDVIRQAGVPAEPAVVEAAEALARRGEIAGRVEGAFRVGGRVLVIAGAAADGWRIYTADDRLRETVEVAGGWAGAAAAVGGYNLAMGWTNAGGPVPWGVNVVGNVVAGLGGYFAGETVAGAAYDLVVDGDPIEVPTE